MGGPEIKTRFGRKDAKDSSESVESQVGLGLNPPGRAQRAETGGDPWRKRQNLRKMVVWVEFNIV